MKSKNGSQEVIEGELVGTGQFLTDKTHMSKKVSTEIEKILNEKLLPYKLYLKHSSLLSVIPLTGLTTGIGLSMWGESLGYNVSAHSEPLCILGATIALGSAIVAFVGMLSDHLLVISPLIKLYRAKKLFKQISQELHTKAMNGEVEVKNLTFEFDQMAEEAIARKELEEKLREIKEEQALAEKAAELKRVEEAKNALMEKERILIERAKNSRI